MSSYTNNAYEVSVEEVEVAKQQIRDAISELPEAGRCEAVVASLRDIVGILATDWNTEGGSVSIGTINSYVEELQNILSKIEACLETVKLINADSLITRTGIQIIL